MEKKWVKKNLDISPIFMVTGDPSYKNRESLIFIWKWHITSNITTKIFIQFWYCTSVQWYNTRNTPNFNSFCWNAKIMSFSNLILTMFTYFLYASTMYKHIFGLILVKHADLGVQMDHNNRFSIIWLSKSIFPTHLRACAPKII